MSDGDDLSDCGICTVVTFIFVNVILGVMGFSLMVGGIVDVVTNRAYSFFTGSNFLLSTNLLIIAGLATFIISFVAWGAVTVKRFILGIYALVTVCIIIMEIVSGVSGVVEFLKVDEMANASAVKGLEEYRLETAEDYNAGINNAIDKIQREFKCCGWTGYEQWLTTDYIQSNAMYPASCECPPDDESANDDMKCIRSLFGSSMIYTEGCEAAVVKYLTTNVITVGGVGFFYALIEIIVMIMTLGLCYCFTQAKRFKVSKTDFKLNKL